LKHIFNRTDESLGIGKQICRDLRSSAADASLSARLTDASFRSCAKKQPSIAKAPDGLSG